MKQWTKAAVLVVAAFVGVEAVLARKASDVSDVAGNVRYSILTTGRKAANGTRRAALRTPVSCGQPEIRGLTGRKGHERRYSKVMPCDAKPSFVMLALHGYTGGEDWLAHSFLEIYTPLAQKYAFILLAPEGLPGGALGSWNADVCCGEALDRGYDDIGFLQLLVEAESDGLPVYGLGFGNGGFMLSKVARDKPGLLSGMAVFAGHVYEGLSWVPPASTAVLMYYSRADFAIRPGGCCQDPNAPKCTEPGVSQLGPKECVTASTLFEFWKGSNKCSGEKKSEITQQRYGGMQVCREGIGCALPTKYCEYTGVQVGHNQIVGATDPHEVVNFFRKAASPTSVEKSAGYRRGILLYTIFATSHLLFI